MNEELSSCCPFIPLREGPSGFYKHLRTLTASQREFIHLLNAWFQNKKMLLILVSGPPGSGKTHTVIETLKFVDANNLRMAHTARVAARISGRTIHSTMSLPWGEGSELAALKETLSENMETDECLKLSKSLKLYCPSKPDILIIDEIGMVPFWLSYWIIKYFHRKNPNILSIFMGDVHQLGPVKSKFSIFEVTFPDIETIRYELKENKRFVPEYQTIIDRLREIMNHQCEDEVEDEVKVSFVNYIKEIYPVVEDVDVQLLKKCNRALVFTNATVEVYNRYYLSRMPKPTYRIPKVNGSGKEVPDSYVDIRKNCLIYVTENNCGPVTNGHLLRFLAYDQQDDEAICIDPETCQKIKITRSMYTGMIPIALGFAGTIHKFQGETIDEDGILFNFDGCTDLKMIYTALSRVKRLDQIIAVKL